MDPDHDQPYSKRPMRTTMRHATRHATLHLLAFLVLASCGPAPQPGQPEHGGGTTVWAGVPDDWGIPAASATPVWGAGGMVSSTDRVASEVGAEMLRRGGNAFDAAIAVHFALAVVNPEAGNIGGGGFMVAVLPGGQAVSLDFRERAPGAATRDMFLDDEGNVTRASVVGHLAAGVPGSVAGMWEVHQRYGSLPWAEILEPAINLADGMVVHDRLASSLRTNAPRLRQFPATAAAFLPGGQPPRVGDRFSQPDLRETLRRIARDGRDGFYRGRTADLIVAEMGRGGGLITHQDLAGYQAAWRDPVAVTYRGHRVISMPPSSSGGPTVGLMLNILAGYDLASLGFLSPEHVHLYTEASRRAFADRNVYLADPDFVDVPVADMISAAYADRRREEIRADRATPSDAVQPGLDQPPGEATSTTHYSVTDAAGNAVAITTTINSLYGNRVTVTGAGFLLNNEMDDFTALPGAANQFGLVQGEANAIEPGKRMLSAMTPTIVLNPQGRPRLVLGSPGGPTIISSVVQVISNMLDFGMTLPEAVAAPRLHHQHLPDVLRYERDGLRREVVAALRAMGHEVEARPGYQGDVTAVHLGVDGGFLGVADPRRGGAAVGLAERAEVVQ
jgi:gamma-glutamyltranspeptidase / glutathione hydrolase